MTFLCECGVVETIRFALFLLGLAVALRSIVVGIIRFTIRKCNSRRLIPNDLGEWAVVTGATDGIGKAMSFELAKKGFSICLISRNMSKLKDVEKTLSEKMRNLHQQVKCVEVDFGEEGEDLYVRLSNELKDLNIGVLVNNVGISYPHPMYYNEVSSSLLEDLIKLNIRSVYRMTHIVYDGMIKRKRGVIVCVGSGASVLPSEPLYAAYTGAKGALEAFCRSLQPECASKNVLVQCHTPLLVTTKLSKCKTPSLTVPSTQQYAQSAMMEMERGSVVLNPTASPYFVHKMMMSAANTLCPTLWNLYRLPQVVALRARAMKKKEQMEMKAENGNEENKKAL